MKTVVCVKQVPDTVEVAMDPESGRLMRQGVPGVTNPFDQYAVEEAVRIRERLGGAVIALSMGPPGAAEVLRDSIARGADEGVLLSDAAFAGSDTLATAYTLSRAIERIGGVELVICGKQAVDGDTGQVGPCLAQELGMPHVAYVRRIVEFTAERMRVERMVEDGVEVIDMEMPGVVTVVKDINEPRLPTLKTMMKAKKAEIRVWGLRDLRASEGRTGTAGSPTQVVRVFTPNIRRDGRMLRGCRSQQTRAFIEILRAKGALSMAKGAS